MMQVKSFEVKDGEGISKFLKENTLAKEATILISNGWLAIPYEDGVPMTPQQKIIRIKELMHAEQANIDILYQHDIRILEVKIDGIQKQIEEQEEKKNSKIGDKKRDYDTVKEADKEIKRLTNMVNQAETSINQTKVQITDSMVQISVYGEEIGYLEQISKDSK